MPLDPILATMFATTPPLPDPAADIDAYRAAELAGAAASVDVVLEPAPDGATRRIVQLPVDGGSVELHVYTPDTPGPHPGHLYLHGGGWIGGSITQKGIEILCRERAVYADCVVVTVEYRKAPEHRFPTGFNDCYTTLEWIAAHADELGIRRDVLTIGGGSAGANLAAAVALRARDEHGPQLALQLLDVPALDLTMSAPSFQRNATGYLITAEYARTCVELYLETAADALDPYASPLLAESLADLPPAHLMPAEFDPISDDAAAYATRLTAAGVPVTLSMQYGQFHGSSGLTKVLPAGRAWRDEQIRVLQETHRAAGHATPAQRPAAHTA